MKLRELLNKLGYVFLYTIIILLAINILGLVFQFLNLKIQGLAITSFVYENGQFSINEQPCYNIFSKENRFVLNIVFISVLIFIFKRNNKVA